jgi:hypothetical protein
MQRGLRALRPISDFRSAAEIGQTYHGKTRLVMLSALQAVDIRFSRCIKTGNPHL